MWQRKGDRPYWLNSTILAVFLLSTLISSGASEDCFNSNDSNSTAYDDEGYTGKKLEFTLDIFHKLYKKEDKKNLFFSPSSIHEALLLAFFGAQGKTEAQLRDALKLGDDSKENLLKSYKMHRFIQEASNSSAYTFKTANRLYFSNLEPIRPCMSQLFEKELKQLNFNETEESRNEINGWVLNQTDGKIKDLIPPGGVTSETRIAIVNTAYFRGKWIQQFKKSRTKLDLFYVSENEVVPTMMMYTKGSFRRGLSETLQAYIAEIPYEGERISLFILLPPFTPNAIEQTISNLNASTLQRAMDTMTLDTFELYLPRFKIEQTFELSKTLKSLGISELFSSNANLRQFSEAPGLSIGQGIHKSYLEVDEEGSIAAAATSLISSRSGHSFEHSKFKCNHPFVFFLFDKVEKEVIFVGAFRGPGNEK